MYFGPGRESTGVVVVCTIGKGLGTRVYNLGQKVRNSDLTHFTWTFERELSKLQSAWGWESVAPALPHNAEDVIERVVRHGLQSGQWWDSASERSGDASGLCTEDMDLVEMEVAALTGVDESPSKLANDFSGGKKNKEEEQAIKVCFQMFKRLSKGSHDFIWCDTQAILAWATLVDKYLQKIASSVKPDRMILLPTGAAAYLPA